MTQREGEHSGRLLAFYNPKATYHENAERLVNDLKERERALGLHVIKLATQKTIQGNMELLARILRADDRIVVASGDGGLANVLVALMELGAENPVATVDGGNCDDVPHMLHPEETLHDIEAVLSSPIVPLRPIRAEITTPDGVTEVQRGFGYWSIGMSADISDVTCDPDTRSLLRKLDHLHLGKLPRGIVENWIGLKAIATAMPMTLVEDDTDEERRVIEFNVLNGDRQGGMKLIRKGNLLDDRAGILEIGSRTPRAIGRVARQILQSDLRWIGQDDSVGFRIYSPKKHFTQGNGEATAYPSGTHYRIGLDPQTVNVYASLAA